MNKRTVWVFVITVFLLCLENSQAGSIWAKRNKNMKDLYADDVAHKIGDVLTITITEQSVTANTTKRDLEKTTDRDANFDGKVGIGNHMGLIPSVNFGTGTEYKNTLSGSAAYTDNRSFTDSITVVVEDILPNDNLVVLGIRSRDIDGDRQIIEVSGIVRPSDIAFDNTIKSEQVANFCIVTKLKGVSEPYNKPNWLGSIFDIIWPF